MLVMVLHGCTLFEHQVGDGVEFTAAVEVGHLRAHAERQVEHAQAALSGAGRVQQRRLHVHAVLVRQLVVVLQLHSHRLRQTTHVTLCHPKCTVVPYV